MLISFEGIDGSGKTTQISLMKEYIEKSNYEVIVLREPGGTEFAEQIRDILLHSNDKVNPISELFLFESARADLVTKVIEPNLDKIILIDRFFDSTTSYQGYGRGLSIEYINIINTFATNSIKPDITYFLDISFETSMSRSSNKHKDRIEKSGKDFFKKVIAGFNELADKESERIAKIDAEGSIEDTHKKIIDIFENKFSNNKLIV